MDESQELRLLAIEVERVRHLAHQLVMWPVAPAAGWTLPG